MDALKIKVKDSNTEDAGLLRTSTQRQQDDGDSPEIQQEKISFAVNKQSRSVGIWVNIAMPASGQFETQPLLKALPYFATIPTLKRVWIALVNRATRAELFDFLMVQREYAKQGLELCDPQGELSTESRDTLESFGVTYKFNQYDANEANRVDAIMAARKNWRDNLTQLHAAEMKAARMGFWVSGSTPVGYKKVRRQTSHGKRLFLEPDNDRTESLWIKTIFDLAIKNQPKMIIINEVNKLGYRSRTRQKHNKNNKNLIEGNIGGKKLNLKQLDMYLKNPIYALIRNSKSQQTGRKAVKIFGTPFITIDQFNAINEGRLKILAINGEVSVVKVKLTERVVITKNANFPFKRFVLCPVCKSKLYGSSPRGKSGRHFPMYHCSKNHKYWSVNKETFDKTILDFTKGLKLTKEKLEVYKEALLGKVKDKLVKVQGVAINHQIRVTELESLSKELLTKIRNSKLTIVQQDLENELEKVESEKLIAIAERNNAEAQQIDIRMVIDRVIYFLEHLEKGLLGISDPVQRAAAWSTVFEEPPTYQQLVSRTPRLRSHVEQIATAENAEDLNVGTKRLELLTSSV